MIQLTEGLAQPPRDRELIPPHLSVWVDAFTTPEQAYGFLPENSPRKLVLRLKADASLSIEAEVRHS